MKEECALDFIEPETIACLTQHIKAFYEQSAYEKTADFGEPCAKCEYGRTCNFDWLAKMKPVLEKSKEKISMAR